MGPVTPDFRIVQDKTVMRISRENHQCGYCQVSAVLRNRERGSRCGAPGWAAALEPQDAGSIRARQSGFRELHTPPGGGGGGVKRKQTKKKTKKTPRRWACRPPTYDAGIRLLPGFNQPRLGLWCRGTGTRHREVSWAGDSLCQGYKSTHGLQKTAGQPLAHRAPTCGCIRRQRTLAPPTSAAGALISVPIDGPHD